MRKVLRDNAQVAHYWANGFQSEGRAGNMFFEGARIYSYGRHFCIARMLPNDAVAFTTRDYSVNTMRHKSEVRSAIRQQRIVYCHDPADSARQNMAYARHAIRDALLASERPRIRQTTRDAHKARALALADNANAYLGALPEEERQGQEPINTGALENVRAELERAEEAAREIADEQRRARHGDLLESLEQWRRHEVYVRTGLYELPPALRLSQGGSEVETSHGARIPVTDARKLWALIQRAREGRRDFTPGEPVPVGAYRLTKIRADGSIVVGCHDIAFAEIERIAVALDETL